MNRDSLERLLIDQRLGELAPDASELLRAWLAATPTDSALASEIDEIITMSRNGLHSSSAFPLPIFPEKRVAGALRTNFRPGMMTWHRPAAVAATIVLAFVLGTRIADFRESESDSMSGAIAVAGSGESSKIGEFWSIQRIVEGSALRRTHEKHRINWTSPLARPKTGDAL